MKKIVSFSTIILCFFLFSFSIASAEILVIKEGDLRLNPQATSKVIGTLSIGDEVELIEEWNNWYKIKLADGKIGWAQEIVFNTIDISKIRQKLADAYFSKGDYEKADIYYEKTGDTTLSLGRLLTGARTVCAQFMISGSNQKTTLLYDVVAGKTRTWNGSEPCDYELRIEISTIDRMPSQISPGFFQGLPYTEVTGTIKLYHKNSLLFTKGLSAEVMGGIHMGTGGSGPIWPKNQEVLDYIYEKIQKMVLKNPK